MSKGFEGRMRLLESKATVVQRRTLPGLVALCESGKQSVKDLSDEELAQLITGLPGDDVDVRHLSDEELTAIING